MSKSEKEVRATLRIIKLEPMSLVRTGFLISVSIAITMFTATLVIYLVLAGMGVFESIDSVLGDLTGSSAGLTETLTLPVVFFGSIVVGDENYGEGSSREHAAMEPRFRGGVVIFARSFARIHETNLKKQGLVPLTFKDHAVYDLIGETDSISVLTLPPVPDRPVQCVLHMSNGKDVSFEALHTFSDEQVEWFKAGSALNIVKAKVALGL